MRTFIRMTCLYRTEMSTSLTYSSIKKLTLQLSKSGKGKNSKAFLGKGSVVAYRITDNPD
ncbi:unnamed protein product, partial [Brassica rapa]